MASPLRQTAFVGGEVTPSVGARVDLAAYRTWLKTLRNWIVMPQGGVKNRPGTQLAAETKDSQRVTLVPFKFSQTEAYVLEFGDQYVRFYRSGAQIILTDLTPVLARNDSNPDQATEALSNKITVPNHGLQRAQGFVVDPVSRPGQVDPLFRISKIRVKLARSGLGDAPNVQVALRRDVGGLPDPFSPIDGFDFDDFTTATMGSIPVGTAAFVDFDLINPSPDPFSTAFDRGQRLHLIVRSDSDATVAGFNAVSATTSDQYAGGAASAWTGTDWVPFDPLVDLCFEIVGLVTVAPIEIVTPYTQAEAQEFKGRTAQSADVLFIPHHLHAPAELKRFAEQDWSLVPLTTQTDIAAPLAPTIESDSDSVGDLYNPTKRWLYVVTAINAKTGAESYASVPISVVLNISTIKPAHMTITPVEGASGYNVYRGRNVGIYGYIGTTQDGVFYDDGRTPDETTCPIQDPDYVPPAPPPVATPGQPTIVVGFSTHIPPATIRPLHWYAVSAFIGPDESFASALVPANAILGADRVEVTGSVVAGADGYRLYRGDSVNSLGLLMTSAGANFVDLGAVQPDYAIRPKEKPFAQAPGGTPIKFDTAGNFPSVAVFMDQSLIFAGTDLKPDSIFGSRKGAYRNFGASSPAGDDDAFEFTLAALTVDRIMGMIATRVIMAFTGSSEYVIKGTRDGAIGPSSIDAKAHTHCGSGSLAPLAVGGRVLFSQREGQAVREFRFDFQQDGYTADDERSVLANHMLEGHEIVDWAYAKGPNSVVWMVRDDGVMLGMTYMPSHDVIAWHRHETDGQFEAVACIPEGTETAVYVAVKRGDKRFVERFASRRFDSIEDAVFLDCSLTYRGDMTGRSFYLAMTTWEADEHGSTVVSGDAYFLPQHIGSQLVFNDAAGNEYRATITDVSTIQTNALKVKLVRAIPPELRGVISTFTHAQAVFQFPHLGVGKVVSALVDGQVVKDLVVDADGNVTLPYPGSVVTVGLPYESEMETLDVNINGQGQTIQKVVGKVWFEYRASRGLWAGESGGTMREWKQRRVPDGAINANAPMPLATGRDYIAISGGWGTNGRVVIQQRDPLPAEILSLTPEVTFGG